MVNAGDTVKWVWDNGDYHIGHLRHRGLGLRRPERWAAFPEFSRTFTTPGTFPYHCQVHGPRCTGTITVM